MNSSELAALCGITVRTLRHYHQVGVLGEPPRGLNRYRQYTVGDMIRVLRIRRLAAIGIPLAQMPPLLDETSEQPAELLNELDRELEAQIRQLTAQRELIGQLRDQKAAPDLPPQLAHFLTAFATNNLSPAMAQIDRDQAVLIAHLVGDEGMPHLISFFERISDPELLPRLTALNARFERLTPDTSDKDISRFVDDLCSTCAVLVEELDEANPGLGQADAGGLLTQYATEVLNGAQQRALELVSAHFENES